MLFVIVGASGVGKDTLMSIAKERLAASGRYSFVRRVITRPSGPGENHDSVTVDEFAEQARRGSFFHSWSAHGLHYGLPSTLQKELDAGIHVVANGSREAVRELFGKVSRLTVIEITAPQHQLRKRISERQRETGAEIETRINRVVEPLGPNVNLVIIKNNGSIEEGVDQLITALTSADDCFSVYRMPISTGVTHIAFLPFDSSVVSASTYADGGRIEVISGGRSVRASVAITDAGWALNPHQIGLSSDAFEKLECPEGASVFIRRTPSPSSRNLLRRKIDGGRLSADEYEALFHDIVEDRYPSNEVAAFLVKTIQSLDDEEVVAVAIARTRFMPRISWNAPIVVDKHSIGGVPGNRITLIVVPIIAAHGFLMPKTSSRAITSASGTADVMEAVSRVDLDPTELSRVVNDVGGSIAWNGRLNHNALDDVVNRITRPLGLDSNRWSVASIMSKKWTAGSTHVVVDLPFGPRTKIGTYEDAVELGRVFERVGSGLGLTVRALATAGSGAIGRGIGPALELRDVLQVLDCEPDAPADLREKALIFAAEILAFDKEIVTFEAGYQRAQALLASGDARSRFEQIAFAQGKLSLVQPGSLKHIERAGLNGIVKGIDGWQLASIARRAGAPSDKTAGIDLKVGLKSSVEPGTPLYTIHSSSRSDFEAAVELAALDNGISIASGK